MGNECTADPGRRSHGVQYNGDVAKRTETEPAAPPPPPDPAPTGRRPRARRETAELTVVTERTRTAAFWGNRPPRAMSEAVTMIAPEPAPRAESAPPTRAATSSDDFLDEAATDVRTIG